MALTIGDNFSYQGAKPLDGRIKYDTLAAMKAMADSTLYDGCLAYCKATDKTYQWKSTNTVDPDTGKWREFTSGGGTGGGHTIEDPEGAALTQRDTLQFGGDLEVSDDDENEKTVVTPHELTAAELAEIVSPLPGQPTQGITIDLRGNEQVVGKVIEADGTEKTLYQKTHIFTNPTLDSLISLSSILSNADKVWIKNTIVNRASNVVSQYYNNASDYCQVSLYKTTNIGFNIIIRTNETVSSAVITFQYTKTIS